MLMPWFPECSPYVSSCMYPFVVVVVVVDDCVPVECDARCWGLLGLLWGRV